MILYRARENLLYSGKRIPKGAVHSLDKLDDDCISILIERGRISMYRAPPLEALPKFKYRASRLKKYGMGTVELFSLDAKTISERTGLNEKLLCRWKSELKDILGIKESVIRSG